MKDSKMLDMLMALVDGAFSTHYSDKENEIKCTPLYESIEDYTAKTGKRFRMTKDQKQRNLTRDEAFSEFTQIEKDILGEIN
tara:strand:- start:231 stop:476 length:246 start_codon:yes stop_codon:yes gene_type:complete